MSKDSDSIYFYHQVISYNSYGTRAFDIWIFGLLVRNKSYCALLEPRIHLESDAVALLHSPCSRDILDMVRHALDIGCALGWIETSSPNAAPLINPRELLSQVPEELERH